jgi:hypothetical protein
MSMGDRRCENIARSPGEVSHAKRSQTFSESRLGFLRSGRGKGYALKELMLPKCINGEAVAILNSTNAIEEFAPSVAVGAFSGTQAQIDRTTLEQLIEKVVKAEHTSVSTLLEKSQAHGASAAPGVRCYAPQRPSDRFAWTSFQRWLTENVTAKEKWAPCAPGIFGGDESATRGRLTS